HTVVLPTGGIHITNDLAVGLRAPFSAAEEIKINYGHASPMSIPEDEFIDIAAFGDEGRRTVSRREVAEIISARVDEICQMILTEVKRSGYDSLLPAGVVLCGGTAELNGIKSFAREVMQMPVRVGAPREIEGFTDRVSLPAFATSVGLVQWGWKQAEAEGATAPGRNNGQHKPNPIGGLFSWAKKAFLPG
ncbi:MAG: rod shape-determining protein, partial [Chloroflexota bacterium]|nr:rod shape-determining protein [Chloroflexota bacterium]